MLTIKQVTPSGNHWITEAEDVSFTLGAASTLGGASTNDAVSALYVRKPGDVYEQIREGDVYIMNSSGSTVAVYHLSSPTEAQGSKEGK